MTLPIILTITLSFATYQIRVIMNWLVEPIKWYQESTHATYCRILKKERIPLYEDCDRFTMYSKDLIDNREKRTNPRTYKNKRVKQ